MAKKILIVDDDPSIVAYLTQIFRDSGYETCSASNGSEALKQLEKNQVDLITTDIEMPELSGPKLNRLLSREERYDTIPIVVITGHMGLKYVIPKAVATLDKPFDKEELLEVVRKTIGA